MILVIDNFDSFTYNLVQYMGMCGAEVEVVRNNALTLKEILDRRPAGIMLSPGPCTPNESGICVPLLEAALSQKYEELSVPIFGVCLGMQAVGMVSGAPVIQAKNIRHGKASPVDHDGKGLFTNMPNPFQAIRYHSLVVQRDGLPPEFEVTATAMDDGEVMGLRHRTLPIEGVQFHPESVLTENGIQIVRNFVERVG